MNNMTSRQSSFSKAAFLPILCIGLLVGTLDILAALTDYYISTGKNPLAIFKFIASGVLGMDALKGDSGTILLGLLLHYIIALIFTGLFFGLFIQTNLLPKNKIVTGIVYGIFIWAVMNFIVLPISKTPKGSFDLFNAIKALLILVFMIGLPLSFLANRFFSKKIVGEILRNQHF